MPTRPHALQDLEFEAVYRFWQLSKTLHTLMFHRIGTTNHTWYTNETSNEQILFEEYLRQLFRIIDWNVSLTRSTQLVPCHKH